MAEVNYDRLQANTGIDFEALRQKYKQVSSERKNNPVVNEEAEAEVAAERAKASERERIREENASAMKTLDAYKICRTCQGQGTIKEVYNHFNIEKTCPECDGEAVLFADLAKSLNIS
jgi:DnaJ-class molecular chaperone